MVLPFLFRKKVFWSARSFTFMKAVRIPRASQGQSLNFRGIPSQTFP